jgi:C1q domain
MLKPDIFDKIKGLEERIKSLEGGNQTRNLVIPTGGKFTVDTESADPTVENGRIYYNSTSKKYRVCKDGAWNDMIAGTFPKFIATYSGAIAAGNIVVWGNELLDNSNNYNVSSGIFTAPITGTYIFGFNILLPNAGSGEYRVEFFKNGGLYDSIIKQKLASTWETIQGTVIVSMTAGDYMGIYYAVGTGNLFLDANYNRFWGGLLA